MAIARSMPVADGSDPFMAAVVLAGSSQGASVFKAAPVNQPAVMKGTNLSSSTAYTMTLALMRSSPLYSTGPGNCTVLLPLVADMADVGSYVFNPNQPNSLIFAMQMLGTGLLFLNPAANVSINWGPYGDIRYMSQFSPSVMLKLVAQRGVGDATSDLWIAE